MTKDAYVFKGVSKDEIVAKISKAMREKGNMFNPPMGEGDAEKVQEVVPEKLLGF